jgi:hypothetical protein
MSEKRRARRRSLPYLRGGVLSVDGRSHIVVVTDLSPGGAFLATRAEVPEGHAVSLRVVLPRDGREAEIPCDVVRRSHAGLAVRFQHLEPSLAERVEEFTEHGLRIAADSAPADHFEYRVIDMPELDPAELNHLGLDGWELTAAYPTAKGVRVILLRRI